VCGFHEGFEIGHRTIVVMNRVVVRYVVAVVTQRRLEEGEKPDTVDTEVSQVVELFGQPFEITEAIAVAVVKGFDM